jgi:putative oxidoreductase
MRSLFIKLSPILYLVARVSFGVFMATHGYPKLMNMAGFIENVGKMFPLPMIMGPLAVFAELVGGILVAIGYKTRLACVLIFFTMIGAAFVVHAADPFSKKEFALVYAILALVFMAKGSGRFSLDRDT